MRASLVGLGRERVIAADGDGLRGDITPLSTLRSKMMRADGGWCGHYRFPEYPIQEPPRLFNMSGPYGIAVGLMHLWEYRCKWYGENQAMERMQAGELYRPMKTTKSTMGTVTNRVRKHPQVPSGSGRFQPQFGHSFALEDISCPHSGHFWRAIDCTSLNG